MQDKTIVTITALVCLTIIQAVAWALGFNGQITVFVTALFTAVLGFFTGINFTVKYQK